MHTSDCYTKEELQARGFERVGREVRISRKCSLYAIRGQVGDFVRVDDFTMLTGHIVIGNHVHISANCYLGGSHGSVVVEDFCGVSQKVSIFTGSDDFRGGCLNNPTVPEEFTRVRGGKVTLRKGCLVGAHSVVLPGVTIGEGASIGALCIVSASVEPGDIIVSASVRTVKLGTRDLEHMRELMDAVEKRDRQREVPNVL